MNDSVTITIPDDRDIELWVMEDLSKRLEHFTFDQRKRIIEYLKARFVGNEPN